METWVLYNNKFFANGEYILASDSRAYRYGDGFFETMKCVNGKIILEDYHVERFFKTMELLQFEKHVLLHPAALVDQVNKILKKNRHSKLSRIRLSVARGRGGLYDPENHHPNMLIETYPLTIEKIGYNSNGLEVGIYKDAVKSVDQFSHLKTNNYLCYAMAALHAKKMHWNEAFICNASGHIADATIANIFTVKDGVVSTPALSQGAIDGVMRRHLILQLRAQNIPIRESIISTEHLKEAQEVFVTNTISGVRWVKQIENNRYTNSFSSWLYKNYIQPMHEGFYP